MAPHRKFTVVAAGLLAAASTTGAAGAAAPTAGNKPSHHPDVSATGRYVVFASDATNLVAGDTNGRRDVFVRDVQAGTTRLVSKASSGVQGNRASFYPSISGDGRYVAFMSDATNLVAGDTNGDTDAYRADLTTGRIVRVSVNSAEKQANGDSEQADISGDGRYVVFGSAATNLVAGDTNGSNDIFMRDLTAGTTRRISLTPRGTQLAGPAWAASVNRNGSLVGFTGISGATAGVLQWSRATGKVSWVQKGYDGEGSTTTVDEPRARNAAVSSVSDWYSSSSSGWSAAIRATPTRSFNVSDSLEDTDSAFRGYDVDDAGDTTAVIAALPGHDTDSIYIAEQSMTPGEPGARAELSAPRDFDIDPDPSISGDGRHVVYVDGVTRQIMRWSWATGTVTLVSSS